MSISFLAAPAARIRPGFTLIEMLVVIAIVSMLMAILLPVLTAARKNAQTLKCLANQQQIGIVAQLYANDNKDHFPMMFNPDGYSTRGVDTFPLAMVREYLTGQKATFVLNSTGYSTNASASTAPATLRCPGMELSDQTLSVTGGQWRNSYGFNCDWRGGWMRGISHERGFTLMSDVKRPSFKVYAMDWGMPHIRIDKLGSYTSASFIGAFVPGSGAHGTVSTYAPHAADHKQGRHNLRVNVLYVDGHASTQTSEAMTKAFHGAGFTSGVTLYGHENNPFSIAGN